MRFHKPIGIFLIMWPSLWALWIAAKGMPSPLILTVFLLGTMIMRAAGCIINDIADRNIDRYVQRTKERPLTTGKLTTRAAIILFAILYAAAFALVCLLNTLTIQLAIVTAILAALYPFAKRYTHWPQLILGLTFSSSILMAFSAITQHIPPTAWLLFSANVLWTITYDTEYAITDRNDDLKLNLKSTAILFGRYDRLCIALLQVTVLTLLFAFGKINGMYWPYYFGLALGAMLFSYHQRLIFRRDPQAFFKAFLHNNWFGLIIFLGIFFNFKV